MQGRKAHTSRVHKRSVMHLLHGIRLGEVSWRMTPSAYAPYEGWRLSRNRVRFDNQSPLLAEPRHTADIHCTAACIKKNGRFPMFRRLVTRSPGVLGGRKRNRIGDHPLHRQLGKSLQLIDIAIARTQFSRNATGFRDRVVRQRRGRREMRDERIEHCPEIRVPVRAKKRGQIQLPASTSGAPRQHPMGDPKKKGSDSNGTYLSTASRFSSFPRRRESSDVRPFRPSKVAGSPPSRG